MTKDFFERDPLFLAPLAGFSDPPLRGVVKKFGCDATVSEMISANALVFEGEKTLKMLEKNAAETPFFVQIAGSDAEIIKKAVLLINKFDGIDGIDLNCGCPVPKVVKQGAGSALLLDLPRLSRLVETIKKYSNKKFTSAKVRLGFGAVDIENIAHAVQSAGADFIAIHGRTRAGGYSAAVDYGAIARAKRALQIPVIANGDINSSNAPAVRDLSGADALMIGRAVVGRPWIFREIKTGERASDALKREVVLYHFSQMLGHYGSHGVAIFRKHLHEYSKGRENAASFREQINHVADESEMARLIEEFFS